MVIWIIGLSGSGKSTLGRELFALWKKHEPNTVMVDGDEIRAVFGQDQNTADYTLEARKKNADRICGICQWLDKQGQNVVCCIQSLFESSRAWNRTHYSSYYEVYITVPMDILIKRNPKNLYQDALDGRRTQVAGIDIPFQAPENPDLVIDNAADGNERLLAWSPIILRRATSITDHYPVTPQGGLPDYPYDAENRLETPVSYSYSTYWGRPFVDAWLEKRRRVIHGGEGGQLPELFTSETETDNVNGLFTGSGYIKTRVFVFTLINALKRGKTSVKGTKETLDTLVKRFEVTKKIYTGYDRDCRPQDKSDYQVFSHYLWAGYLFSCAYESFSHLSYLNAFLKINDILCSVHANITEPECQARSYLILQELTYIKAASEKLHLDLPSFKE